MGRGVVAHGSGTENWIDDRIHFVAESDGLFRNNFVREDALHRLGATEHVGNNHVSVFGIKPAVVAYLSAGVSVETGMVQDNFRALAGFHFLYAEAVFHQRQNFAASRDKL